MEGMLFAGWFLFSIIPAVIAVGKGRSPVAWFFISLVLSPLLAGILAAVLPGVDIKDEQPKRVPCPQCADEILPAARICPHCRSTLEPGWSSKRRYLSRPA